MFKSCLHPHPTWSVISTLKKKRNLTTILKKELPSPENLKWKATIGLEVHAQLNTKTKLFSRAPTSNSLFCNPNTLISLHDVSVPGSLPVLNKRCVQLAVLAASSLNCSVSQVSTFDRKHYFYADMPSGYQITQHRNPLAKDGHVSFVVNGPSSRSGSSSYVHMSKISRVQLEVDSGKSLQDEIGSSSLIDLNRCGTGLIEIVFEPDLRSGQEAACLVRELILILEHLNVCTCKMGEGALRVDANVSINRVDEQSFGVRTEIKNINSLKNVRDAIDFEITRQIKLVESGEKVCRETRNFNDLTRHTETLRKKEGLHDYRFMADANLPPLRLDGLKSLSNSESLISSEMILDSGLDGELLTNILMNTNMAFFYVKCLQRLQEDPLMKSDFFNTMKEANIFLANFLITCVSKVLSENSFKFEEFQNLDKIVGGLVSLKMQNLLPFNICVKAVEMFIVEQFESLDDLLKAKGWPDSLRDVEAISTVVNETLKTEIPEDVIKYFVNFHTMKNGSEKEKKLKFKMKKSKARLMQYFTKYDDQFDMALLEKIVFQHLINT